MTNPFESADTNYVVLRNDEAQYSLWPVGLDVPAGWAVEKEESSRGECLEYIESVWTDMRPAGLVAAMGVLDGGAAARPPEATAPAPIVG
ncbi:MbtH family protein [Streptomyces sp. NPDC057638]|uniref:MbtH family protein n=1 Tax=Streptomyces sp. NPDC057638 TaxID=3346190 RepID=UPI0036A4D95F